MASAGMTSLAKALMLTQYRLNELSSRFVTVDLDETIEFFLDSLLPSD